MYRKRFRVLWLVVLLAVTAAGLVLFSVRKQVFAQNKSDVILDYESSKKTSESEERKERNRRFNHQGSVSQIREVPNEAGHMKFVEWWLELSALPTETSDAIVIGTVTNRSAHLSEDETTIYTEYEVKVEQVLKDTSQAIKVGENAAVVRTGGGIRFKSGKVQNFNTSRYGVPQENSRYVFFLKRQNGVDLSIVTGYRLAENKVIPLDGNRENDDQEPLPFEKYRDADESTLLNALRDTLKEGIK